MRLLAVPIKLDALFLEQETNVVGPPVDFQRMPFTDAGTVGHPDVPFLGSALETEPLAEPTLSLSKGCHLHWALPEVLTRSGPSTGAQQAFAATLTDVPPPFPPVPDRWLIRRGRAGWPDAFWLVESNAYALDAAGGTVYPLPATSSHNLRSVSLGRTTPITAGAPPAADAYLPYLTAVGYGNPAFHAFYPTCRAVFGFYDPEVTPTDRDNLAYEVLGWYSHPDLDHLAGTLADLKLTNGTGNLPRLAAQAAERFGWDLTCLGTITTEAHLPDALICFARLDFAPSALRAARGAGVSFEPTVAMASAGTEALSALLARDVFPDASDRARLLEEQLEALHLAAQLRSERLDLGPRFQEARHANRFTALRGADLWGLRVQGVDVDPGAPVMLGDPAALPDTLGGLLQTLNDRQQAFDTASARLAFARARVYADWHAALLAAYPVPSQGESLPSANAIAAYVDTIGLGGLSDLVNQVAQGLKAIEDAKKQIETVATANPGLFELVQRPGPRYWCPNEPVILLAGHADATDRHGDDEALICACLDVPAFSAIEAWIWSGPASAMAAIFGAAKPTTRATGYSVGDSRNQHPFLLEWEVELLPMAPAGASDPAHPIYPPDHLTARFRFDPDRLEWVATGDAARSNAVYRGRSILTPHARFKLRSEMEVFFAQRVPAGRKRAFLDQEPEAPAQSLARDAWLLDNWMSFANWYLTRGSALAPALGASIISSCLDRLAAIPAWYDADDASLNLDAVHAVANEVLRRACFEDLGLEVDDPAAPLTAALASAFVQWYRRELHLIEFLAVYRDRVDTMNRVLSQALSGLNDAFLMNHQGYCLPIADPQGPAERQALAARVAAAVGNADYAAPMPDAYFAPFLAGQLEIHALRLVDTFGLVTPVPPGQIAYPSNWQDDQGRCWLPPRLVQPAQLDLRWLSADAAGSIPSNDHPETSPIVGWLVPNALNESLDVYTAAGEALGAIDGSANHWAPAPGAGVPSPDGIQQPLLRAAVVQVIGSLATRPLADLLAGIDTQLNSIEPENIAQHQAPVLWLSRPLALVRAGARIRTRDPLAISSFPADLMADIQAGTTLDARHHAGLDQLQLEVRIGNKALLTDGVVGLWPEQGNEDTPGLAAFQPGWGEESPAVPVVLNGAAPVRFIVLMDPRATLTAYTGLLPAKTLSVPPAHLAGALGRMEVTFLSTPVLAGEQTIRVPLMDLEGSAWSWVEKQETTWSETPLDPAGPEPAFSQRHMIREGWLKLGVKRDNN
ncbi:MAG TPA: hypothetical protein PLX89_09725 [Verrucomicrobiota bacterium]|nr:hypothetical protein [Verrucomicrobiales bacterium]HRI13274.1 hypothetical protein [Verrucomicrobiota bacterium]